MGGKITVNVRQESRKYHTLPNLNRRILFFGLTSMQVFLAVGVIAIMFVVQWAVGIIALVGIGYYTGEIRKEAKKGNPDYIETKSIFSASPKTLEDNNNALKYLSNGRMERSITTTRH